MVSPSGGLLQLHVICLNLNPAAEHFMPIRKNIIVHLGHRSSLIPVVFLLLLVIPNYNEAFILIPSLANVSEGSLLLPLKLIVEVVFALTSDIGNFRGIVSREESVDRVSSDR